MSDFFDRLANSAKQAQSDRIIRQSQKKLLFPLKKLLFPFATYQGKDPVDGTDRVAIDGVVNSGYKLESNAPLSIGERVYLRPNQSDGLQRVDARNRPVIKPIAAPPLEPVAAADVFAFGFALFANLRVDLTVYDEFGDVDQYGFHNKNTAISTGIETLNFENLIYSDPERVLINKVVSGTTGSIDITAMQGSGLLDTTGSSSGGIWTSYTVQAVFQGGCAYNQYSATDMPIAKLTKIGFRLPQFDEPVPHFIVPTPPYAYDLVFSASNFYVVPYAQVYDALSTEGDVLSDGQPLVRSANSGIRWDGEVYDTGDTLIRSWSSYNRNDDPNGEDGQPLSMFPSIVLNNGEYDFDLRGFAIDDMYDGEIRDVDYWWRYRRNGAANWYDL